MRRLGIQQTAEIKRDGLPTPAAETKPAPALIPAFFHKSPLALYDITAPIPAANAQAYWTPYSRYDCAALEEHYQKQETELLLVGIERLHHVNFKDWTMQPVYWTFKNASATSTQVCRGIWFYTDLQPVPDELATVLERGYHEVRPWTEAYEAELKSATALGNEAEAKLRFDLNERKFAVYRDEKTAWLGTKSLTSRLTTSLYASIGRRQHIEVIRGYTFVPTSKPKTDFSEMQTEEGDIPRPKKVTDLILVIHGIGQKLAETSEGWTFTHAVNRLRLLLHEQLTQTSVMETVRDGFCPQILPVNWRINLDLEASDTDGVKPESSFALEDITIDSIPAVRDLIGKVVFDIPYYMSHHKPRMIAAVVSEANRIYALWLKNNKDFESGGRVHIICHSLGAAISFDILSSQPNDVKTGPSFYDTISRKFISEATQKARDGPGQFTFNTHNLICAGSPAAFFLLLKQRRLKPRRGMKGKDPTVTGIQGTYGCLAAMDIYNVFYSTDPIAYRLVGAVDGSFGKLLPPTQVPSNATPYFKIFKKPKVERLPSQVEMEDHDFERELIADRRLHLLNENGQIDYALPSTGFMDNQYLSMIYAHQNYWDSKEFARMIVIECGRPKGAENTLTGLRGVKLDLRQIETKRKL